MWEQSRSDDPSQGFGDTQCKQHSSRLQILEQKPWTVPVIWRKEVLPSQSFYELAKELVAYTCVIGVLDDQAGTLCLSYFLPGLPINAVPHRLYVAWSETHNAGWLVYRLVASLLHEIRHEQRIIDLDHCESLMFGKTIQRLEEGLLVQVSVGQRSQKIGAPTLQRASENAKGPFRRMPPQEYPTVRVPSWMAEKFISMPWLTTRWSSH